MAQTQHESETRIVLYICITVLLIVVGMVSCTMHSNTYDPQREAQETLQTKAESEATIRKTEAESKAAIVTAQANAELEKNKVTLMENLIAKGASPIEARCAIFGWDRDTDSVCLAVVKPDAVVETEKKKSGATLCLGQGCD